MKNKQNIKLLALQMADNELDRLIKLNDVLQSRADSAFAKAEQSVLQGGRALESTNDSTAIDEIESFTGASNLAAAARNPPQRSSSKQSNQTTVRQLTTIKVLCVNNICLALSR